MTRLRRTKAYATNYVYLNFVLQIAICLAAKRQATLKFRNGFLGIGHHSKGWIACIYCADSTTETHGSKMMGVHVD